MLNRKRLSSILIAAVLIVGSLIGVAALLDAPTVLAQAENQVGILSVVGADGADLYETPDGEQVDTLSAGTALNATGRSADNGWVLVSTSDDKSGWVEVKNVVLFSLNSLPVAFGDAADATATSQEEMAEAGATPGEATEEAPEEEATPTSVPTEPPTPTPTRTPLPTPTQTSSPTPPPTVTSTPASASVNSATILAVVRGGGAQLLESPGGAPIQDVSVGSTLNAMALSEDGDWLQARTRAGAEGWVESKQVIAFQLDSLPRVAVEMAEPAAADDAAAAGTAAGAQTGGGSAQLPPTAVPSSASNLPSAQTQIRRPAPEDTEGKFVAVIAMSGSRLNIRSAPSTNSTIIGKALPDEQFIAIARTQDSTWVQIEVPDIDAGAGWVSAQFVELNDPLAELPVSDEVPAEVAPADAPPADTLPADEAPAEEAPADPDANTVAPTESSAVPARNESATAAPAPGLSGRLVFQTALGGSIYTYNLASGELRHLTGGGDPAISPDGRMVAFTRFGGDGGVYVINIDGSGERRLYASAEGPRSPSWSPDGKYIVFSRLTGEYPCRYIGFGTCIPNTPFTRQLPLMHKDERGLTRIDLNGEEFRDIPALNTANAPDWTSSGIVYQATTSIEITYDTPDYEGSYIFNEIVGYQDPAWQPNGDRILYQDKGPDHTEIWSVHPDGSGNRPLTGPLTTLVKQLPSNVSPAWSPDGKHIVYLSSRGADESEGPWRLWVMDADGGNKRPLPINLEFVYHHNVEQMVSWGL